MKVNYLVYIILGIIQGFTEPIPVSSSGHIFLFKNIFNSNMFNDLNFEIVANFGSFLAILFIFRKDVLDLLKAFFSYIFKKESRSENKKKKVYSINEDISYYDLEKNAIKVITIKPQEANQIELRA